MTVDQSWSIPTEELSVGTPLRFDLVDSDGEVLQKAGSSVDERLKARLLERNVNSFTLYESGTTDSRLVESVLLSSYSQATVQQILASISSVRDSLLNLVMSLQSNEEGQIREVNHAGQILSRSHANYDGDSLYVPRRLYSGVGRSVQGCRSSGQRSKSTSASRAIASWG